MSRIVCAWIARFELALQARRKPALWQQPIAVAELALPQATLQVLTPAAERLGLREGMKVTEALALVPSLELLAPAPELRREAEAEVLGVLGRLSPALDSDGLGAFYLAFSGLGELYASEADFAERVRQALAELELPAALGVADGPLAARVAAARGGVTLVPAGADRQAIAGVPLESFGLPHAVLQWLRLLGIREAGQLARLPPGTLARRLPVEGPRLERLCRGETPIAWPTSARIPDPTEELELELDTPTDALEPLLFIFKSLLDRLLGRVALTRRALAVLGVVIRLDDRSVVEHSLVPARPTLDGRQWLELVRLWLSSAPFPTLVAAIKLRATKTDVPVARQIGLLQQGQEQAADALQTAVKRLAAAFGEGSVVRPVLVDTYLPEARLRWAPFAAEEPAAPTAKRPEPAAWPVLRFLSPPEPVRWEGHRLVRASGEAFTIAEAEGPYRFAGHWWEPQPFHRSYFWLRGQRHERLWIYRDEMADGVFLQAVVD